MFRAGKVKLVLSGLIFASLALDYAIAHPNSSVSDSDGFCTGKNAGKVCCAGQKGLLLPLFNYEDTWPVWWRALLYLIGLFWCFLGVAVLSDSFMAGIEAITNSTYIRKTKRKDEHGKVLLDDKGQPLVDESEEPIWNAAVANLTLMALGSSTPEILLSIIEIVGKGFYAGELGPGTVVGSAAFNLYFITGICMVALPAGETRKIEGTSVYFLTASHSLLAYAWMAMVVTVISPDVIEWWEALITFLAMPWLVTLVYCADKNWFRKDAQVAPESVEPAKPSPPAEVATSPGEATAAQVGVEPLINKEAGGPADHQDSSPAKCIPFLPSAPCSVAP